MHSMKLVPRHAVLFASVTCSEQTGFFLSYKLPTGYSKPDDAHT